MFYNSGIKAVLFVASFLLLSKGLFAQSADTTLSSSSKIDYVQPFSPIGSYRTWSIGFNAGIMTTANIFTTSDRMAFTIPNIQYGYGGYIKKQITSGIGIQGDFLAGKLNGENAQPDSTGKSPFKSFSSTIKYAVDISGNYSVGNINFHFLKCVIQPFATAGVGIMNYRPTVVTESGVQQSYTHVLNEVYLPVGAGLKFNVARGVNIELAYQVNFVTTQNLEGYKWGTMNGKYSYSHIGLEFAIGKRSKPQLSVQNPVASMRQEYLAGIGNLKSGISAMQTQIDSEKAKNQALEQQVAASNAVIAKLTADSDGDGVPDFFDKCPGTPAGVKVDGSGCPLPLPKPEAVFITEEDRTVVNEAVHNLEFATGQAIISEHSYPSLDRLAKLLADKKLHLKLAGYTDATGSAAINLRLSKDRAEAVKIYLVSKGADASLIQSEGYGKAHPIASNKTKAGRALNRRVEFSLY
jgi:OOP family OmpA-OmpF porin